MKTVIIRAICITALAVAIIGNCKAQSNVTYETRHHKACAPTYLFNQTGQEYVEWTDTIRFENGVVEEVPLFTYAIDTDGDGVIDERNDSSEACEKAATEKRRCEPLPYGDQSLVFEVDSVDYAVVENEATPLLPERKKKKP